MVAIALRNVHSCVNFLFLFVACCESLSFHCVPMLLDCFTSDCDAVVAFVGRNCCVKWTCFGRRNFFCVDTSRVAIVVIVSAVFVNWPVCTKRVVEAVLHWMAASTKWQL